jgi:CBS domain containing-hemolysin-like protein
VDVVALPEDASASQILETALATRYSRIPVYKGDIDNISGVVFSKDLLQYVNQDFADNGSTVKKDSQSWKNLSAAELMQPTYFIPESMKAWNALQEMRRRRIHMAIIVDEYGGTSGLVTFEDLLEEVC